MSEPLPSPKRRRGRPPKVQPPKVPLAGREGRLNTVFPLSRPEVERADIPELPPGLIDAIEGPPPEPPPLTTIERDQLRDLLSEFANRSKEALRLFEPMPEQTRFFACEASERIALGGNRGGKTTVTCMEIARAVTGQDPFDKYPKESGRAVLVGKDLIHCSKVFYRKLFKAGAFKIIRDADSGLWRSFRPNDPADIDRQDEAEPAPPLISPRFIKQISWENKKEEIPKTITLKNNWELCFFSSLGAPPQGWDVDIVAFDEEIEHPLWYREMSARLLDRRRKNRKTGKVKSGKFLWSATPQAGTQQLYELKRRADAEAESDEPATIVAFGFGLLHNTFMTKDQIDDFCNKLKDDEEEYRIRVLGEFAILGTRVYGEFAPAGVHGCDPFPIPPEWTIYASLDPGRQVCAILFAAVPPPGIPVFARDKAGREVNLGKDRIFLFDELYIKKANADSVARAVAARLGDRRIEKWYIDGRAGRITEIGSGKTHEQQYREAFIKHKVFAKPGPLANRPVGFIWSTMSGGDDVKAGIEAVRLGLVINEDGASKWCVFREKLKNFLDEAETYSYKRLPNGLVTDEVLKHKDHLMDDWRYLACGKLRFVKGKPKKDPSRYTNEILAKKKARKKAEKGDGGSILLG